MNIRGGEEEWFSNLQSVFRNPFSNGYKHNIKSSSEKGSFEGRSKSFKRSNLYVEEQFNSSPLTEGKTQLLEQQEGAAGTHRSYSLKSP